MSQKPSIKHLCVAFIVWISALSILLIIDFRETSRLSTAIAAVEQNNQIKTLEAKTASLAEQLITLQAAPGVQKTELLAVRQDVTQQIAAIRAQLSGVALKKELTLLQSQLAAQQALINKLPQDLSAKTLAATAASANQTPPPAKKTAITANLTAPFQIVGVELRDGKHGLIVLPKGEQANSALLLGVGQHMGNWQLHAIDARQATFKVGADTRRIAIH